MDCGLNPRWESGMRLGLRWGTAARIVAASPHEAREVRPVARRPFDERWSREALQDLVAVPW
eukprot:14918376-Alexandrium_andersonii.AAC.2